MGLSESQRERLFKLLNLTRSDNDNEAISAIRHANSILKTANLDWSSAFGSVPSAETIDEDEWEIDIDDMLKGVLKYGNLSGGAKMFIESLQDQYLRYGRLTPNQRQALEKFYFNCKRR